MLDIRQKWDSMPASVRNAIIALFIGWGSHYAFYFGYLATDEPGRVTYLWDRITGSNPNYEMLSQLAVGTGICYCVATIKKWARKMCIYFNIGMVAMYALFAIAFALGEKFMELALTILIAGSFAVSLYWLLKRETAQFFSLSEKKEPEIE